MKDQQELLTSHAAGFGGSDASMVLAIAERLENGLQLTTTQKHRLRIIRGLELPTSSPETENTLAGHAFEDEVSATLPSGWEREYKIIGNGYDNFVTFAHADFFNTEIDGVKECKWSRKYDKEGLKREYAAQLQWYYTVCKVAAVSLCYDTAEGKGVVDIERNAPLGAAILDALAVIDREWDNIDLNITELTGDDVPQKSITLVKLLRNLNEKKEDIERQIEETRAALMEQMKELNHTKYSGDGWKVSIVGATVAKTFDSKKFLKDHAALYAAYLKDSPRKATMKVEFRKKEEINNQNS